MFLALNQKLEREWELYLEGDNQIQAYFFFFFLSLVFTCFNLLAFSIACLLFLYLFFCFHLPCLTNFSIAWLTTTNPLISSNLIEQPTWINKFQTSLAQTRAMISYDEDFNLLTSRLTFLFHAWLLSSWWSIEVFNSTCFCKLVELPCIISDTNSALILPLCSP